MSEHAAHLTPALVCALYSEDRADAQSEFATLRQVVWGMLKRIEEHAKSNHLRFLAVARDIPGSFWKVHKSKERAAKQKRRDLLRAIATELHQGRVVFFHVDGDCVWANHQEAHVWEEIERFRQDLLKLDQQEGGRMLTDLLIRERFTAVIPFYSIESWTYANTARLGTLTSDSKELERITAWTAELELLDEVEQIKESLPSIRDRHNAELAKGIPTEALMAIGKSYAATLERLRSSPVIVAGLAETARRPW